MENHLWFYEKFYGRLPVLSRVHPTEATILLLLVFEAVALAYVLLIGVPFVSVLIGTLMIFMIALWTELASYIAPNIRAISMPEGEQENIIMRTYKELVFRNVELALALSMFAFLSLYYKYTDWNYFRIWVGSASWVLFTFGIFISWEVCYRASLTLWTSVVSAWRSISLLKVSSGSLSYQDLKILEKLDRLNLSFALIAAPLYLVSSIDPFLGSLALIYLLALLFLYLLSTISLRLIPCKR